MLSQLFNSLSSFFSNIFKLFDTTRDTRILILGLDAAGKTTIMYKVKIGEVVTTIPTIGFNVEQFNYKNLKMVMWDIGGQLKIRCLWRHYYSQTDAIIFVVDSNDRERLDEVKEEIHNLCIQDELKDSHLLVYANKQDMQGAMSIAEVADSLDLHSIKNRKWFIQSCSAITGDGIYEGFEWISNALKQNNNK